LKTKEYLFFIFFIVSVLSVNRLCAQISADIKQIIITENQNYYNSLINPYKRKFLKPSKNRIAKYNPLNYLAAGTMYVYQNIISIQLQANCSFHPSCSEFGKHAVDQKGLIMGILLTSDRLLRCNQFADKKAPASFIDSDEKIIDNIWLYK
jgi:uncharacterized protein